jgi:hypothetical protein
MNLDVRHVNYKHKAYVVVILLYNHVKYNNTMTVQKKQLLPQAGSCHVCLFNT